MLAKKTLQELSALKAFAEREAHYDSRQLTLTDTILRA
jgi:hypothetical protein